MQQFRRKTVGEIAGWFTSGWLARGAGCLTLGLVACSGVGAGVDTGESGAEPTGPEVASSVTAAESSRMSGGARNQRALEPRSAASAIGGELDTLLLAVALADERITAIRAPDIVGRYQRVADLASSALAAQHSLDAALQRGDSSSLVGVELDDLSRLSAQLPVQIKRIKQALRVSGVNSTREPELFRLLDTVKLAARSLSARVLEVQASRGKSPLASLPLDEQQAIVALNGPLSPSSSWYVLDEGHIDAMDVAYEDAELGISIHDESVDPGVEREPATTIMVVKSTAKVQVPDARFAFLGPVGADVWILPEGQPEAEAAGILWAGVATEEIEADVLLNDTVDIRFGNLIGPDGLSLFESPQDELTNPEILMDSEDGLPDTLTTPVGIHRHMNWAFESPGVYLLRVQARGRLAALPGNPWVSSSNVVLKFVVLP
jgi:surface-anchored protein